MNEDKKGPQTGPNGKPSEDKLDRWIEETLHEGTPKKEDKFIHEGPPKVAPSATHTAAHATHPTAATQHKSGQQAAQLGRTGFYRYPKKDLQHAKEQQKVPTKLSHTAGTGATPSHARAAHTTNPHMPAPASLTAGQKPNQSPKRGLFKFMSRSGMANKSAQQPAAQAVEQSAPKPAHPPQPQPVHYRGKLKIIPLGGLDEVGKNCMALEYATSEQALKAGQTDIIIIDMGFQFPEEDMLGIDYVIPDTTYLEDKLDRIKGILITHGHLDHIGAIPYLLPKLNFPMMYGTRLTMGLIDKRLEEFGQERQARRKVITTEDVLQLGAFSISFFPVNHSIPDAVGIVVKTPAGNIVHTGDFKFDYTPSGDQKPADFAKIAGLSSQNIAALFIDSTNALKPGYTVSEKKIGDSLESIIKNIEGRVIIASFASQIGRMQQIIDYAHKYHRKIFLSGRSLIDNVFMAQKLGYLRVPTGLVHDIRRVHKIPEQHALILTTGSQGESMSALTRMALEDHSSIKIKKGDTVVLSSSPIPGNERAITTVVNNLARLGARIINNQIMDVHTSGHAQQEDLKLMMSLVKPRAIVPVHGEYFMRLGNRDIAMSIGYDEKNCIIVENGGVIEIENGIARATGESVQTNYIMVDGLGVGDVGAQVMMDRQTLAENGVLIVLIPVDEKTHKLKGEIDIISRGFIYMKESEELIRAIKEISQKAYHNILEKRADLKRGDIKKYIKESVDKFVHQKIERHPLVLPVIVER